MRDGGPHIMASVPAGIGGRVLCYFSLVVTLNRLSNAPRMARRARRITR